MNLNNIFHLSDFWLKRKKKFTLRTAKAEGTLSLASGFAEKRECGLGVIPVLVFDCVAPQYRGALAVCFQVERLSVRQTRRLSRRGIVAVRGRFQVRSRDLKTGQFSTNLLNQRFR